MPGKPFGMEVVSYGGWERCGRFAVGDFEALITLDVGPRVIRLGFVGQPNVLANFSKDLGKTGDAEYHSYGGHRLWIAPEENPKTMQPDNDPVEILEDGGWQVFRSKTDRFHIQKEIAIKVGQHQLWLRHRLWNRGVYAVTLAPWALTVMDPGGICVWPQHPYVAHVDQVLPARPIVLWTYTDMSDPRWTWGNRVCRMRQDPNLGSQKVGALVQQGLAAYSHPAGLFVKRFGYEPGATYPDFGCNFEVFSRQDMLEVESLGPLATVSPDGFAEHLEAWSLLPAQSPPSDDDACAQWLEQIGGNVRLEVQ
jgi:hypothetical protein